MTLAVNSLRLTTGRLAAYLLRLTTGPAIAIAVATHGPAARTRSRIRPIVSIELRSSPPIITTSRYIRDMSAFAVGRIITDGR